MMSTCAYMCWWDACSVEKPRRAWEPSMYLACVGSVAWGWDISWSRPYVCVCVCARVRVCYFSGRIGMMHGFPTDTALVSGMCFDLVVDRSMPPELKQKNQEMELSSEITSFFFHSIYGLGWIVCGRLMGNGIRTTHLMTSHAYSDQLSTHPIIISPHVLI